MKGANKTIKMYENSNTWKPNEQTRARVKLREDRFQQILLIICSKQCNRLAHFPKRPR
jgi:hypothetical protein